MIRFIAMVMLSAIAACASLSRAEVQNDAGPALWRAAHAALDSGDFAAAEEAFSELASAHPETPEGREALFFVGSLRLDPRNPEWNPAPAEQGLRGYLQQDGVARRPEATTLLQLAQQLNMPPEQRVAGLQPPTRVIEVPQRITTVERCSSLGQVDALRRQVAEKDEEIRKQREELERIRRTLTPRTPPPG